jgi:hypothetical protein
MVASDGDSQAVHFAKPNALHRTGHSVGEDHGLADKLSLGLLSNSPRIVDARPSQWAWVTLCQSLRGSVFAFERCTSRGPMRGKRVSMEPFARRRRVFLGMKGRHQPRRPSVTSRAARYTAREASDLARL